MTAGFDAVVLAGGASRRFGGGDKTTATVGERTVLDRVLDALGAAGQVVVAGPHRTTTRAVRFVREDPPGAGPLAAVGAALAELSAPVVVLLAGDLPFVTAGVVERLRAAAATSGAVVAVDAGGRDQPLLSAWRTAVLAAALDELAPLPGVAVRRLLDVVDAVRLAPPGEGPPAWFDCDTPEDLQVARSWL